MTFHIFNEARANFEAQRREQAAIAAQALEMKLLQRDLSQVTADLKVALQQLEAPKAAPAPPKPATAAPAPKAAPPARKATPKPTPQHRATPQSTAIDGLEARLSALSPKINALASRLKTHP